MFYVTVEVTQVDEDLAANAIQSAIDALAITLPMIDIAAVEIGSALRSRGANATFILEKPSTTSANFVQAVTSALKALVLVRLHWVKPTVIIDLIPVKQ